MVLNGISNKSKITIVTDTPSDRPAVKAKDALIAKMGSEIIVAMSSSTPPPTLENVFDELEELPISKFLIDKILERKGLPISERERAFLTRLKKQLPALNKTLISYEMVQRQTVKLDTTSFRPIKLDLDGQSIDAFDVSDSTYQFLVHTTNAPTIDACINRQNGAGIMCTSLVTESSAMYGERNKAGLILDFDPKSIVATTNLDAFTPCDPNKPATREFYNFYQRLQIYTSHIDNLYRESGLSSSTTDDFSRWLRLIAAEVKAEDPAIRQEISNELAALEERLPEVVHEDNYYEDAGVTQFKLDQLIAHHKEKGNDEMVAELNGYKETQKNIVKGDYYHSYIHPIVGPTELNLQTDSLYNEINIDLFNSPVKAKAILVTSKVAKEDDVRALLKDAVAKNIPILVK